ncbi:MAG TPA: SRPBCC family protein [Actinomycetota bacterium]|nr:SRPBCC family protein [Actinomycetota bacterium]
MPAPVVIVNRVAIARPPSDVWRLIVDWERSDRWMEDVSDVRVTTGHREGLGVEAVAAVRIAGITTRDRIRVTRWEPPHRLEIDHLGWVRGHAVMDLAATAPGTALTWEERFVPPWGVLGALGMRVFVPVMRRVFRRDIERLRTLAEGGG